jgi:hypothetical protein
MVVDHAQLARGGRDKDRDFLDMLDRLRSEHSQFDMQSSKKSEAIIIREEPILTITCVRNRAVIRTVNYSNIRIIKLTVTIRIIL